MKNICRKIILLFSLIFACSFTTLFFAPTSTYADDPPASDPDRGECPKFLGLTSWDCGANINNIDSTDLLATSIWTIVSNISVDIIVIASYLTIGFVIYGGYLYIFAAGDPSKVATGKKTLFQAFIGLALVLSSYVILNAIRIALGNQNFNSCITAEGSEISTDCYTIPSSSNIILDCIQWVIGIAGIISVIFVVYGAISYVTSSGDAGKVQKAKNLIMYSLIGLIIVALAEVLTSFIGSRIREATNMGAIQPSIVTTLIEENSHEN